MATLKSVLLCRCPKCNEGKLFVDQNPYHLKNISKMVKVCPVCGFDVENETGFHFMSMYMSYILTTGFSMAFIIPLSFLLGLDWIPKLLFINALILVVLWPLIFRWARIISLWLTVKYKME